MSVNPLVPKTQSHTAALELGERLMLRCAWGYLFASVLAAALGFAAVGRLDIRAIVFILLFSALLLAAGLFCGALGALAERESQRRR